MASDIALVLRSEHRHLLLLADRCARPSRGFQDPDADLRNALIAHLSAASSEVYSGAVASGNRQWANVAGRTLLEALKARNLTTEELKQAAETVVQAEVSEVLPALEAKYPVAERRRMGKVFRIRRDVVLRSEGVSKHRQLSQTELYEQARRAGVEQRSRMTQAELQSAVAAHASQVGGPGSGRHGSGQDGDIRRSKR